MRPHDLIRACAAALVRPGITARQLEDVACDLLRVSLDVEKACDGARAHEDCIPAINALQEMFSAGTLRAATGEHAVVAAVRNLQQLAKASADADLAEVALREWRGYGRKNTKALKELYEKGPTEGAMRLAAERLGEPEPLG